MKLSKWFIVIALFLFVLMILIDAKMPKKFNWDFTFYHLDKQPFGCWVFDSVMSQSVPNGYSVSGKTFYQLAQEKGVQPRTFLCACEKLEGDSLMVASMERLLSNGNHIILATGDYWSYTSDSIQNAFDFHLSYGDFNDYFFSQQYVKHESHYKDTLMWLSGNNYSQAIYGFNTTVTHAHIVDTKNITPLAVSLTRGAKSDTILIKKRYKSGLLLVMTMPIVFTNYGMLDDQMRALALRTITSSGNYPVVRIDPNISKGEIADGAKSESPLRYLLNHRPLRWALYLSILAVLATFFFTAKRRQRIIPVYEKPANRAMELVRHIGSLYYQRHDNVDLLRKKYMYFSETIRRTTMIDIDDENRFVSEVETLSQITGISTTELTSMLREIDMAKDAQKLSDSTLRQLIKNMNLILKKL